MKQGRNRFQISREPIIAERVRHIEGGFAFIEHRFLHRGYFASLEQAELVLYFLLVIAADRRGVSFYANDALSSLCRLSADEYLQARNALIAKDLIAYDGHRFQVLSLPEHPTRTIHRPLMDDEDFEKHDPTTIRKMMHQSLGLKKSATENLR